MLVLLYSFQFGFAAKKKTVKNTPTSVVERLRNIETFEADFTQETTIKGFSTDHYSGKLYMVSGKHALWDYNSPYKQYYLFNENGMEFYDSSTNQVVKQTKNSSKEANVILSVLFNLKSIENNFNIISNGKSEIQLKPKVNIGLKYLILTINKSNVITGIYSEDEAGNITKINFTNIKINHSIDQKVFTIAPPKDAVIYKY